MAGRRRSRATGHDMEPTQRARRPQRRREALAVAWARTASALERAELAFDYWRGAARRRRPDPAVVDQQAEVLARLLVERGDQLLAAQGREVTKPGRGHSA